MHIDKRTVLLIQNSLRQASIMWHVRADCLKAAKHRVLIGQYKNGKDKYKVKYLCARCAKSYNLEDVEVDHIVEVAYKMPTPSKMTEKDLIVWIKQLFCASDNLQVLCKGCHAGKTQQFVFGRYRE